MRKQTRRSISLSGPLYARVRAYCEAAGISLSSLVEGVVAQHLGGAPSSEGNDSEEDELLEASEDREESLRVAPVEDLQEVDPTTAARQEVEHVKDEQPEEQPVKRAPEEQPVEREPERRIAPRRPAADPALRVRSSEPDNPELGGYIPPHLLF